MFTCACGWSGLYWARPTADDSGETAAYCLFYHVICDLAGYPTFVGSDRGRAFVEGTVRKLVDYFGIKHVIGSSYHPQSQAPVERPHREYNTMCRTFCDSNTEWDLIAPIFVWTIRTTAKTFNGNLTPYELVTGLQPRTPVDYLLSQPSALVQVPQTEYLRDLCNYLREIHKFVDEHHSRVREDEQRRSYRLLGPGVELSIGDYVMVKRPPEAGTSQRLQSRHLDDVYQVVEKHGDGPDAKTVTLSDLRGNRDSLGFSQPIAIDRLTPVEMFPLAPTSEEDRTRILIYLGNESKSGTVTAQCLDGKVYVRFDGSEEDVLVDLVTAKYQWL